MNYLVLVDFWFRDIAGGSERVAWDIARVARDKGWSVTILCANPDPVRLPCGPVRTENVTVVRYTKPVRSRWNPLRMESQISGASEACMTWLADQHWDIVHVHSPVTGAGALKVLTKYGRIVCTVHSPIVDEQRINWARQGVLGKVKLIFGIRRLRVLERRLLKRAHAIHTLSEYTRQQVVEEHDLGHRATVVPHWCNSIMKRRYSKHEARRMLGWPRDRTVLFTVRRHTARYGIDVSIRALADVRSKREWVYYIGGDGPLRSRNEALARDLGLAKHIHFMGRVSDDNLMLAYQAADMFLLPTVALECFGLIIVESLSHGCPVIGTDAGAIPEVLGPILPNVLVPAGNVAAMRSKIEAFLDGQLQLPDEATIINRTLALYGENRIIPRIMELLEGRRAATESLERSCATDI